MQRGLVEATAHLRRDWLVNKDWVVVPVESASHFDQADVRLLSRAFEDVRIERLVAIASERLNEFPNCLLLDTSEADLTEFSSKCSHFNFLLTTADRAAAVLCTVYDYYLVAGPIRFVTNAVGGDVDVALARFRECASDPCWEGRLEKIVKRYELPKVS